MQYVNILILLLSFNAYADQWLCKEEASLRQGNAILACGVGSGTNENEARSSALNNAMTEFKKICESSADCKNHEITIDPKRMTCSQVLDQFKCYRLIAFNISKTIRHGGNQNAGIDNYTTDKDAPKLHKGMTKKEVLAAFGVPISMGPDPFLGPSYMEMQYEGAMCATKVDYVINVIGCSITLKGNRVWYYTRFKPVYTEDLADIPAKPVHRKKAKLSLTASPNYTDIPFDFLPDESAQTTPHR